ncbi:metal ABC transporter solute-binding protein, Zn/Mn family [Salinicoccus albus]|uniref:metal ABC transporter solute-binding protein, Zn/Mn family n=1 Tax=Salinicoccus albus TaxID=418756 RepID=UPI00037B6A67|nr:zinc ABC transporter substrate-binding protein [Salinicoccus albus]
MKKVLILLSMTLFALSLTACSDAAETEEDGSETATIYTTVFPLQSFTEQIAGDTVTVETIYPNGVDAHSYEPTQQEILEYAEGSLFIYTTDALDPVAETITSAIGENTEAFAAAEGISEENMVETDHAHEHDESESHDHEHAQGSQDPHLWLDPVVSISMAESILDRLIEMYPEHEDLYNENFEALKSDLEDIDSQLQEITQSPKRDSVYISHESIGYLADRYHFEQIGISGINNQQPSQQALTEIVDSIESTEAPYILYEQNTSSSTTDTIRNQTDTEPLEFHNISVLTDDDPEDATYQSIMQENIEVLDRALNE